MRESEGASSDSIAEVFGSVWEIVDNGEDESVSMAIG